MAASSKVPPLSRSTSRLKVRDHLNRLMGHGFPEEKETILFAAPAARSLILSHENSLVYKYLLYRQRLCDKTQLLYFKWWLWIEDEVGCRMDELLETVDQLGLKLRQVHRLNARANAERGQVLSLHFMRIGIEPSTTCPVLEHGECVIMKAEIAHAQPFFDHVALMILRDDIYRPMAMTIPVAGVSLVTYPGYSMITLWLPPTSCGRRYSEDEIFALLLAFVDLPQASSIVPTAIVVDNDSGSSYEMFE